MRKLLVVLATGVAAASVAASSATAAPMTPNGLCGAANMVNANALPGMMNAMFGNGTGNGNDGMFAAVARTACS